jgi:FkbM family methyltransferase
MFISFAQQFEDVLLWRALKHVEQGFYIDIGAHHPEICSVSKAFYDHNWRGVHVEPMHESANLFREHRPDEMVLEVAIGEKSGIITFYDIAEGLATADSAIAEGHRHDGRPVKEITVPCIPLFDLLERFRDRDIHWLKIDVEGFELSVLKGWRESSVRPWIVVIESTLPNTQIETHQQWEDQLLDRGYTPVLFDGLNRYYVSEHHPELQEALRYGPTVFDNFVLSTETSASYCALYEQNYFREFNRAQQLENDLNLVKTELEEFRIRLTQQAQQIKREEKKLAQAQEDALQLKKQAAALRGQLEQRKSAFNREHERAQQLQIKWGNAKEKIDRFRKKANEFERESNRLSEELASVYSSKSWKFGAPLRIGQRAVKKIFRLLKGTPAALPPAQSSVEPIVQAEQVESRINAQTNTQPNPKPGNTDLTHVAPATRQVYEQLQKARSQASQETH